jgi:hypothetical protein
MLLERFGPRIGTVRLRQNPRHGTGHDSALEAAARDQGTDFVWFFNKDIQVTGIVVSIATFRHMSVRAGGRPGSASEISLAAFQLATRFLAFSTPTATVDHARFWQLPT